MNILIFGGLGTIGQLCVKHLRNNHDIFIIDRAGLLPDEDIPGMFGSTVEDAIRVVVEHSIDLVINLAESSSLSCHNMHDPLVELSDTARLLDFTSTWKKRVVTLLVTWANTCSINSSIFSLAAHSRRTLPKLYNRGNAVVTQVSIPRVLSGVLSHGTFGCTANRILHGMATGGIIQFYQAEEIQLDYRFVPIDQAVQFICSFVGRTTRDEQTQAGLIIPFHVMVNYLLHAMHVNKIDISIGKEYPITCTRTDRISHAKDWIAYEWIERVAHDFTRDWNENCAN